MATKKQAPQIGKSAYVVIDTDGSVIWSFSNADRRVASVWAEHRPGRKIARVEAVEIVRKSRKPKESKR